ncbi:hypothetical protein [Arthrobacter sp. 754]|uniref:hypothetical protein n=1 Tax=Arthrobacter sp. 754 TaxID=3156315 RepID=UPI003397366E
MAARDGHGHGERPDSGEAVTDPLGDQDVGGPPDRCQRRDGDAGQVDVALPRLGEEHDAEQRHRRPDEGHFVVAAHSGHRQRAEEFNRDGGAQRDVLNRGEEPYSHQPGGDTETEQRQHVATADGAQRRAGNRQENEDSHAQPQPCSSGRAHRFDQVHRQGGTQLD